MCAKDAKRTCIVLPWRSWRLGGYCQLVTAKHAKLLEGVFSAATSLVERGLGFFHRLG